MIKPTQHWSFWRAIPNTACFIQVTHFISYSMNFQLGWGQQDRAFRSFITGDEQDLFRCSYKVLFLCTFVRGRTLSGRKSMPNVSRCSLPSEYSIKSKRRVQIMRVHMGWAKHLDRTGRKRPHIKETPVFFCFISLSLSFLFLLYLLWFGLCWFHSITIL